MVPMVTWCGELESGLGEWIVGFIESTRIREAPSELIRNIDGVLLIIDGPGQLHFLLDDVTLDYENGRYFFAPSTL
jgi:hypothetical protein